ncbi:2,3-bisphosphoglycerate-independent phosphoglycerate mutase [Candidatus Sumerlaeota bacterium]
MSMIDKQQLCRRLAQQNEKKIVLISIDGVGGIHTEEQPQTELERANTPQLDALAQRSACGRTLPTGWAVTPGSGPGHLSLFGYDPLDPRYDIGRGVLESLGIDFDVQPDDVCARGNFCSLGADGLISDRRAGRIPTEECLRICEKLQAAIGEIDGVPVFVRPVKDYRFCVIFRSEKMTPHLRDTDPQQVGKAILPLAPLESHADCEATKASAAILQQFVGRALELIKDEERANGLTLRGISRKPEVNTLQDLHQLDPCCLATYPLYRGVAKLVGMKVVLGPATIGDTFDALEEQWHNHNFFFIHIKPTDAAGEDGDSAKKIAVLEEVDTMIPRLLALEPDAIVITGDHSTPPIMKAHSYHPVPVLVWGPHCDPDDVAAFGEMACNHGRLLNIPATELMPLALANADKLIKYGA